MSLLALHNYGSYFRRLLDINLLLFDMLLLAETICNAQAIRKYVNSDCDRMVHSLG